MAASPYRTFILLLTLLLTLSHFTTAQHWYNGGSIRFSDWFPKSTDYFADVSTGVCNASLRAFENAYYDSPSIPLVNLGVKKEWPVHDLCDAHASCILEHTSEMRKASLATAGVLLGLMPTLLAVLSPSISELVLLSSQRPMLASILSVGAPGVLQRRIFEYEDPFELIEATESLKVSTRSLLVLGPWNTWKAMVVALGQYLLALACAVNTTTLAIQTSNKSVISWGCTRTWPLILWVVVPTVIHWISAVGYRLTLDKSCAIPISQGRDTHGATHLPISSNTEPTKLAHTSSTCISSTHNSPTATPKSPFHHLHAWLFRECTSCASHSSALDLRHPLEHHSLRANLGIFLNCVASFLSFFHVLYGTVVFSALLFISNLDAISQIVLRGLASAIVCRFLVLVEMGGLRGAIRAANKLD